MPPARRYTYAELADRIEEAFGERPTESTLRAAASATGRGTNSRVRITAGMPAPLPDLIDGRAVFSAVAIDRWITHHPRLRVAREQQRLTKAARKRRVEAVARARRAGLSWQQVADALGTADGRSYTRQWAQQRFAVLPAARADQPASSVS